MPEGPSIVLLREEIAKFSGRRIVSATGDGRIGAGRLKGKTVRAFRSWGKHFLIELDKFSIRIHFLLFGSYTINERKPRPPRLRLEFAKGEVSFYSCAIQVIEGPLDQQYDWRGDVMSDAWDAALARRRLRAIGDTLVCDALLDQQVFAGVGNIIKNEVLFRIRVHPGSKVGALPAAKLQALVREARRYSFEFLDWKREGVLRRNWLVHRRQKCPECERKLNVAILGKTKRRAFFCARCQLRYTTASRSSERTLTKKK